MKRSYSCLLGLAALALPAFASADVIIGNFETSTLDGWGTDGGPGSPVYTQDTVGATLDTHSLKATNPQGSFWGPSTGNLTGDLLTALRDSTQLSLDLTLNNTDLNGGNAFSGFAQSNELSVSLFGNGGAINYFLQKNWGAAGVSDSLNQNAQWNGVDGTRTLVWDLTKFTNGSGETVSQIIANNPGAIDDAKINFVVQIGGGDAPGSFYFDNVRLNANAVPEPTTFAALGLGLVAFARRRRT